MIIWRTIGSRSSAMNMCSVRQSPMPSAPNSRAFVGVLGRVRVRPHAQVPQPVGPREHRLEVLVHLRRHERHVARDHAPGAPVDREQIALAEHPPGDRRLPRLERQGVAARHGRLAHAARDDGRVRGHAAVRGQHAASPDQPVDVVRGGLPADEQDVLAGTAPLLRRVGVEHDEPGGSAGGRVQALGDHLDLRARVDHRVQKLVELPRIDPRDRLLARDQALAGHVDGDAERRPGGALPGPGLEQVELALLDRELDVLHLAEVALEALKRLDQLRERARQQLRHPLDRLRRPRARDDVLALRVDEELPEQARLARRGVPGEARRRCRTSSPCCRRPSGRRWQRCRDRPGSRWPAGRPAPAACPRSRRRRGSRAGAGRADPAGTAGRSPRRRSTRSGRRARPGRPRRARRRCGHPGRPSGASSSCSNRCPSIPSTTSPYIWTRRLYASAAKRGLPVDRPERGGGLAVQPEVQDRVHHPGHRDRGAGAHRHEQRIAGIPEPLAGLGLEPRHVLVDLRPRPRRGASRPCACTRRTPRS